MWRPRIFLRYNAALEMSRIQELAERFPKHGPALLAPDERIVVLLPIARNRYYHPSQHGSWSLMAVLPAICPQRKEQLRIQLHEYCKFHIMAVFRIWEFFKWHSQHEQHRTLQLRPGAVLWFVVALI